jgi:hypothetical protein
MLEYNYIKKGSIMKNLFIIALLNLIIANSLVASPIFSSKPHEVALKKLDRKSQKINDSRRLMQDLDLGSLTDINRYFISAGVSFNFTEDTNILGYQPLSEIVGESGTQYNVKFGIVNETYGMRFYGYGWSDPDKNNEIGLGFGGDWGGYIFNSLPSVRSYVGGQIGFGYQPVKGEHTRISTSVNKLSYVTDNVVSTPTNITYTKDTSVLNIGLVLGFNYYISADWDLDLAYVYTMSKYQFTYVTEEDSSISNNMSESQDSHGINVYLNYKF